MAAEYGNLAVKINLGHPLESAICKSEFELAEILLDLAA